MRAESVAHRPHPALRPLVAAAVGYLEEGVRAGVHRGLPSPHLTLVVTLDEPLRMAGHPDPRHPPGDFAAGRSPDLARLAAAAGFADQAHLAREWQAFSGLSPTRWLAAEVRSVQDGTGPVGARSPA